MNSGNDSSRKSALPILFFSMLYISAFTFGGGFVIVTFMKRKFVDELHWISDQEMLDITALAQSSPGAIAVNAAILVGWKIGGFPGMLTAVLGTAIPPITILSIISAFYRIFAENRYVALVLKGMSCGVAAVILDVALNLGKSVLNAGVLKGEIRKGGKPKEGEAKKGKWVHAAVMALAFLATFFFRVNVIWIIAAAAIVGVLMYWIEGRPSKQ